MDHLPGDEAVEVEFFERRDLPHPSQRRAEALDAELRALSAEGVIGSYRRQCWPKRVPVAECDSEVRDRYLRCSSWARSEGVALQPYFDTRECYCADEGHYTDWLVVPAMVLVVSVDGTLRAVYPHSDGEETVSVEDGLATLREGVSDEPDESVVLAD